MPSMRNTRLAKSIYIQWAVVLYMGLRGVIKNTRTFKIVACENLFLQCNESMSY